MASGETFFIAAFPLLGPLPLSCSATGGCLPKGAGAGAGAAGTMEPSEGSLAGLRAPGRTTPDPAESEDPRALRAAPPRLPFSGGSMVRGGCRVGERASGGSPWEVGEKGEINLKAQPFYGQTVTNGLAVAV